MPRETKHRRGGSGGGDVGGPAAAAAAAADGSRPTTRRGGTRKPQARIGTSSSRSADPAAEKRTAASSSRTSGGGGVGINKKRLTPATATSGSGSGSNTTASTRTGTTATSTTVGGGTRSATTSGTSRGSHHGGSGHRRTESGGTGSNPSMSTSSSGARRLRTKAPGGRGYRRAETDPTSSGTGPSRGDRATSSTSGGRPNGQSLSSRPLSSRPLSSSSSSSSSKPREQPSSNRKKTSLSSTRPKPRREGGGGDGRGTLSSQQNRPPPSRPQQFVGDNNNSNNKGSRSIPPFPVAAPIDEKFHDSRVQVVTSASAYGSPVVKPLASNRDMNYPQATVTYGGKQGDTSRGGGGGLSEVVAEKFECFEEQLKGGSGGGGDKDGKYRRTNSRSSSRNGGANDPSRPSSSPKRNKRTKRPENSRVAINRELHVGSSKDGESSKDSSSRLASIRKDLATSRGVVPSSSDPAPAPARPLRKSLFRRLSDGPKEMMRRLSNGPLMVDDTDADEARGNNAADAAPTPDQANLVVDTTGGSSPSDSSDVSTISATAASADQQALLVKYLLQSGNAANEAEAAKVAEKFAKEKSSLPTGQDQGGTTLSTSKFANQDDNDDKEEEERWIAVQAKTGVSDAPSGGENEIWTNKFLVGGVTAGAIASEAAAPRNDWLPKDQVIGEAGYGYGEFDPFSLLEKGVSLSPPAPEAAAAPEAERSASSSSEEYVDWKATYCQSRMDEGTREQRSNGLGTSAHTSSAINGDERRRSQMPSASASGVAIGASFRRPGRRRMRYERAQRPGAVQMRGRAQGQLPVWTMNGLRHQQTQLRQAECEAGRNASGNNGEEHMVEAVAVTADDMLEGDVVYANAESMPSVIKLFFKDRNVRIIFALFLLALIGGIIGLSLWLPQRGEGASSSYVHDGTPTVTPTAAPTITMAPTADLSSVKNVLSTYSSLEDLNRRGSPQHSAMLWMVKEDNMFYDLGQSYLTPSALQRYVIVVLYYALHDCLDAPEVEEDWLSGDSHECNWGRGISCQSYAGNQFIVALDLSRNGACGTLPPEVGFFDKLGSLIMEENAISGVLPKEMCKLTSLKVLSLGSNQIAGTLLECFGAQLVGLTTLDLSNNRLQGRIPDSNYNMKNLRVLDLSQNSITGTISSELLLNMKKLTVANIASNKISGTIPESLQSLPDLAFMYLDYNLFSGTIPFFSEFLGRREVISLSNNLLSGTLPGKVPFKSDSMGLTINPTDYRMETLDFSQNLLSGSIPPLVGIIPSLKHLDISSNDLTGTPPHTLGRFGFMTNLEYLSLANNQLEGTISTVGYPESTKHIDLSNNMLTGGFPSFLLEYKVIEYLDIQGNNFGDQIPSNIGDLSSLLYLNFRNIGLYGTIPSSLGKLGQATQLDISSNSLTGSIPSELGSMRSLRILRANSNLLTGTIPSSLVSLDKLEALYLGSNSIVGEVPKGICGLHETENLVTIIVNCDVTCSCCDVCS